VFFSFICFVFAMVRTSNLGLWQRMRSSTLRHSCSCMRLYKCCHNTQSVVYSVWLDSQS
jgi:hypothetical protein